jgi:hypothetical protein
VGTRPRKAEDADFIEIRKCRFHRDAAILLCSDGLTDHLSSGRVREIVERYDGDAESVANELVEAANGAGGRDNITALFVAGPEFRGRSGITRPRASTTRFRPSRRALTGRAAFLIYGLLLAMLVWAILHIVARPRLTSGARTHACSVHTRGNATCFTLLLEIETHAEGLSS